MQSTAGPSNEIAPPQLSKQPMHVYVPGLPSFGIPIWSSSPLDRRPGSPQSYGGLLPRVGENDRKPAHGNEGILELKPVILEPVHLAPKPIVVHKPVFVPKPIEIVVHKPVFVHKPIEIHKPAVIHKPVAIPIHKPVFIHKPIEIPVHKPILVHKPIDIKPIGHNYDSLLSQILKQHSTQSQGLQYEVGVGMPHANMQAIETPGFGGLHQTGFVSAHDEGKDASVQVHPDALAPSPVKESHTYTRATDKISSDEKSDVHSDSNEKSQSEQVIEGVFKAIQQSNENLPKSSFAEGDDGEFNKVGTDRDEVKFGSPNELVRNNLTHTITTNMESPIPLNVLSGSERYRIAEEEPSTLSANSEDEGTRSTISPTVNDEEVVARTTLDEGPDVLEDAQKEEGTFFSIPYRSDALAVPFSDTIGT